MTDTADKVIARLDSKTRRTILDAAVRASRREVVLVEYAYDRKLEGATRLLCTLVDTAYAPGSGSAEVLVVRPVAPGRRMHALSVSQVLRITSVNTPRDDADGELDEFGEWYRRGEVLAGPPA